MTVTFCGHAQVENEAAVCIWLDETILKLCREGAKEFLLGGYGHFDALAASAVYRAKAQFGDILSILVLPYPDREFDPAFYDGSVYPPLEHVPRRYAISRRNQWMVERADIVVAYVSHHWGGAAKTYAYAIKKEKQVICFPNKNQ